MNETETYLLHVRNMLSKSCIQLIRNQLNRLDGVSIDLIRLGEIQIQLDLSKNTHNAIDKFLTELGFPLLKSRDEQIIERIKQAAIELIYYANNANSLIRNSDHISERVGLPYTTIGKLFSDHTSTTLEKYIILLKIERVKELITYDNLTVSEISYAMGYSSVQYLSTQFKKTTGYSVSEYKKLSFKPRIPLEDLI